MMKYVFEFERFNVCGDCPCWCHNLISKGFVVNDGFCAIAIEDRNRFDDRPDDCPLQIQEDKQDE